MIHHNKNHSLRLQTLLRHYLLLNLLRLQVNSPLQHHRHYLHLDLHQNHLAGRLLGLHQNRLADPRLNRRLDHHQNRLADRRLDHLLDLHQNRQADHHPDHLLDLHQNRQADHHPDHPQNHLADHPVDLRLGLLNRKSHHGHQFEVIN